MEGETGGRAVKLRRKAWCQTDFPNDAIEDEEDIIQFSGRGIAAALAELLRGMGYESSEPINGGDHGWELDVTRDGQALWCQITDMGEYCILIFDNPTWEFSKHSKPKFIQFIRDMGEALDKDDRFHGVRWYADDKDFQEDGSGGAQFPLSGEG